MQHIDSMDDDVELRSMQDRLIDTVTLQQQEALDSVEAAGQAMVAGIELAQREFAEYLSQRVRQDFDASQALLRCRSVDEMCRVQADYLRAAVGQFSDEAARLMRLGTEITTWSLERVRP